MQHRNYYNWVGITIGLPVDSISGGTLIINADSVLGISLTGMVPANTTIRYEYGFTVDSLCIDTVIVGVFDSVATFQLKMFVGAANDSGQVTIPITQNVSFAIAVPAQNCEIRLDYFRAYALLIQPVTVCDTVRYVDLKDGYRFGFNGKEKEDEASGSGNTVDMGDRWLDVRLGRTPKPDRKGTIYPGISPYTYAANNPIYYTDPDGQVIEPYTKKWGYGWFSWTTYPYFTGGFTGTHGEEFHKLKTSMVSSSYIFQKVYTQLENSTNHFRFTETEITQGGVKGAMNKNNPEARGSFQSNHAGTEEDPFVINFNYEGLKGISGHNNTSTIFEETFHAGQQDYYGINGPSGIDVEVEAKVTKALEGYNTEFSYEGFDDFRTAFINGTATNQQLVNFELAVLSYASQVSKTYIAYKMSKGMSKDDAEKSYGMGAFTGDFKYAESLYGKNLKAESFKIVAPKN